MRYGFGVDLGGTTVKIACFDDSGCLRDKWEIPTKIENNGASILPDIAAAVLSYCEEKKIASVLGVGIGVPGAVDREGVVNGCVNLDWGQVNVSQELEALLHVPVVTGNDANLAALGEYHAAGIQGSMVLVTLGTGVGGGIIIDGKPLQGARGAAGEIGHMILNPEEQAVCGCGKRGCGEQYCSATGIVRLAKAYLQQNQGPSALRQQTLSCKAVFDTAAEGDCAAQAILEQVYEYMGRLIANVCSVIDPETVVLGGGVSKAGQPLLEGIERYFDRYMHHAGKGVCFRLATLGNDAGAYGAFRLLRDRRL